MQRTIIVLSLLVVIVAGAVFLSATWFEYHMLDQGDSANVLNAGGWEPIPGSPTLTSNPGYSLNYRRPRYLPHAAATLN